MMYLLSHFRFDYSESETVPVALFERLEQAKEFATRDARTLVSEMEWEPYDSPNTPWTAYAAPMEDLGARSNRWHIENLPVNPEPGTDLDGVR